MIKILVTALCSIIGTSGLLLWFIQRWINKKLSAAEKKKEREKCMRQEEKELNEEFIYRTGRLLFWLVKWVARNEDTLGIQYCNDDLHEAWRKFDEIDTKQRQSKRRWHLYFDEK